MDMEKKNLIYLFGSFCLLIAITIGATHLKESEEQELLRSSSRMPASVSKGFLLSQDELLSLSNKKLENYLNGVAKILAAAEKRNPEIFYGSSLKTSSIWVYLQDGAFAVDFADGCILGFVPMTKENCADRVINKGIQIKDPSKKYFSKNGEPTKVLLCPKENGRQLEMCSPAVFGFNFSSGKPQLFCVKKARNDPVSKTGCYHEISTSGRGAEIKKSHEILKEVNPTFWGQLEQGIDEICRPGNGGAKTTGRQADCKLLKDQLGFLSDEERVGIKITEHQRLYKKLGGEVKASEASSGESFVDDGSAKACSEIEKGFKDSPSYSSYNQIDSVIKAKGGRSADSLELLKYASKACGVSYSSLVQKYGACKHKVHDSNRGNAGYCTSSGKRADLNKFEKKNKSLYLEARSLLNNYFTRDEIRRMGNMTLFKIKRAGFLDALKIARLEAFSQQMVTETGRAVTPYRYIKEYEQNQNALFSSTLRNRLSGGKLTNEEVSYLSRFKKDFGVSVEDIPGIFCPKGDMKKYKVSEQSVKSCNWRKFMAPCLRDMGFRVSDNYPDVEYKRSTPTSSEIANKCDWKDVKGSVGNYLTSARKTIPQNTYFSSFNKIKGVKVCQKIEACKFSRAGAAPQQGLKINGECLSSTQALQRFKLVKEVSQINCKLNFSPGVKADPRVQQMLDDRTTN